MRVPDRLRYSEIAEVIPLPQHAGKPVFWLHCPWDEALTDTAGFHPFQIPCYEIPRVGDGVRGPDDAQQLVVTKVYHDYPDGYAHLPQVIVEAFPKT